MRTHQGATEEHMQTLTHAATPAEQQAGGRAPTQLTARPRAQLATVPVVSRKINASKDQWPLTPTNKRSTYAVVGSAVKERRGESRKLLSILLWLWKKSKGESLIEGMLLWPGCYDYLLAHTISTKEGTAGIWYYK